MADAPLETSDLTLLLPTLDDVRAMIDGMSPEERAQVSDEWVASVTEADAVDPWLHGFSLIHRATGETVGMCGFKGPPTDGMVEIAYAIEPEYQGQGFATQAAAVLFAYASGQAEVCIVRAHTLPERNASTRVLTKCGFEKVGEVVDPEDGPVWRWEKQAED